LYPEIPYTAAAEIQRGPDPVIGAASNIKVRINFRSPVFKGYSNLKTF
jgi:hypothetical protein